MNKQILFLLLILLIVIININFKNETSESFTSHKSKASFSKKDIKGMAGPLKQTFKIFNSQLLLGTKNKGRSGEDINNEVQLYLGGKINYGSNNGREGHQTYKLKIDNYSKNVYPIYSIDDSNKEPDFFLLNGLKSKEAFLKTNVKVKKFVNNNIAKIKNTNSNKLILNNQDIFVNDVNDEVEYFQISKHQMKITSLKVNKQLDILETLDLKDSANIGHLNLDSNSEFLYNNHNINDYFFPLGSIAAFKNTKGIPQGWFICDGTKGTPDLRDRFLIGNYSEHNKYGGRELITLTIDNLPKHKHQINKDGKHSHPYRDIYTSSSLNKEQAEYADKIIKGLNFNPTKNIDRYNNIVDINNKLKSFMQSEEQSDVYPYNIYKTILEYFCPMVDSVIDIDNRGDISKLYTSIHNLLLILEGASFEPNNRNNAIRRYIFGKVANDFFENSYYCSVDRKTQCETHAYDRNNDYMKQGFPNTKLSNYMMGFKSLPISINAIEEQFTFLRGLDDNNKETKNTFLFRTQEEKTQWDKASTADKKNLRFSKYDKTGWGDSSIQRFNFIKNLLDRLRVNLTYIKNNVYGLTTDRIENGQVISSFFSEFFKMTYGNMRLDRSDLRYTGLLDNVESSNLNDHKDTQKYMGIKGYLKILEGIKKRILDYREVNEKILNSNAKQDLKIDLDNIDANENILEKINEDSELYKLSLNISNQKDLNTVINEYEKLLNSTKSLENSINKVSNSFFKKSYEFELSDLDDYYTDWQKTVINEDENFVSTSSDTLVRNLKFFKIKLTECLGHLNTTRNKIRNLNRYGNVNDTIDSNCYESSNDIGSSIGTNSEAKGYDKERLTITHGVHSHHMDYEGTGLPHSNLPPYYSLFYIMKLI